jgi:hypothetical protein
VPDTLDYLLSINATTRTTHQTCTQAALTIGAAAVSEAHDAGNGGFYELRTANGNVSNAKVWWIQSNAMLALFKLHKQGPTGRAPGSDGSQTNYLKMLAETVWFVRQYQTDNEVAGEQFWQVGLLGSCYCYHYCDMVQDCYWYMVQDTKTKLAVPLCCMLCKVLGACASQAMLGLG